MNEVQDEFDFLHVNKDQRFLQVGTTFFGECGQAGLYSKSNCRNFKREISHKRLDGLPWFVKKMKTFIKTVKGFPILNGCVEPNALSQSSCSILESVISYERSVG